MSEPPKSETTGLKGTPALRAILEFLLREPTQETSVRRVAKSVPLSVATIIRYLNTMTEQGWMTRRVINEGGFPGKVYLFTLTDAGIAEAQKIMTEAA